MNETIDAKEDFWTFHEKLLASVRDVEGVRAGMVRGDMTVQDLRIIARGTYDLAHALMETHEDAVRLGWPNQDWWCE